MQLINSNTDIDKVSSTMRKYHFSREEVEAFILIN